MSGEALGTLVDPRFYIDQNDRTSFIEFEDGITAELTGLFAQDMRANGCGISAMYMILTSISEDDFRSRYTTVGQFTVDILRFHRNDTDNNGTRVRGTPVFSLEKGWYHDALIFAAQELGGVKGSRIENATLEEVATKFKSLQETQAKVMGTISVKNEFWRLPSEKPSKSRHIVVVNGFKFTEEGNLSEIRVTDSHVDDHAKINEWLEVNDKVRKSFTGKAIFVYA